jgi:hypothetical protein
MQFRHFRARAAILEKAPMSDALRKDVDGTAPSDCGASATFGINEDVADVLRACHWFARHLG